MNSLVTIKNGEAIKIRSINIKDASKRHEFFVELSLAQIGIVHTVDEIDFHSQESEAHIKSFLTNKLGLWLIALNEQEKIVGEIDITIKNFARIRHQGSLTMGIVPTYQGLGLGSALMDQALSWAQQNGLTRVELSVFAHNHKAIKLYKKYGFVIEGIRKNFLRHQDSSFEDDIMMAKYFS